jgi:hypothetical protein
MIWGVLGWFGGCWDGLGEYWHDFDLRSYYKINKIKLLSKNLKYNAQGGVWVGGI